MTQTRNRQTISSRNAGRKASVTRRKGAPAAVQAAPTNVVARDISIDGRRCPAIEFAVEQEMVRIQQLPTAERKSLRVHILHRMKERQIANPYRVDDFAHGLAVNWAVFCSPPSPKRTHRRSFPQ